MPTFSPLKLVLYKLLMIFIFLIYRRSTKKEIFITVQGCLLKPALDTVEILVASKSILSPSGQLGDRE